VEIMIHGEKQIMQNLDGEPQQTPGENLIMQIQDGELQHQMIHGVKMLNL